MPHPLSGDQCQYKNLLSGYCRYQSHSTLFQMPVILSRIIFSRGSSPLKYALAVKSPCIKKEVSTRSPPLSLSPKKGSTLAEGPSTKWEKAPWNVSVFSKKFTM